MSRELAEAAAAAPAMAVACAATVVCAWGLSRWGAWLRLVDRPGARKLQAAPVATVGGLAIVLGCAAGAIVAPGNSPTPGVAAPIAPALGAIALLSFVVGLVDDWSGKRMTAGVKAAATLLALLVPLLASDRDRAAQWVLLLPVCFVALHAMNTIDHVNGLAGLVALIGAAAFAIAEFLQPPRFDAPGALRNDRLVALLLAAALAGFLFLNFPRGRVFLGDSGTLLLGGCLAVVLLERRRPELLLLAAVPLADLVSVAWLRVRAGARPWIGDRRHVTHRLVGRGVPEAAAVVALAAAQAGCSALYVTAIVQRWASGAAWVAATGVIGALAVGMLCIGEVRRTAP